MKTELQNEFKNRQISIWQKEKELHVQTKNTLSDLLSAMAKKNWKLPMIWTWNLNLNKVRFQALLTSPLTTSQLRNMMNLAKKPSATFLSFSRKLLLMQYY